ncbi:MAG TPA: hypothetical protein VM406_06240 [Noviherbaspirillum sp.]|nr:hypothetical protein [Noviherbaspirillum sp.]
MLASQMEDKCALPRCTCAVPVGQPYCSESCRREHADPDEQGTECPCGHAECTSAGPSGGVTL